MRSGGLLFLVGLLIFWNELTCIAGQPEICLLRPDPGLCKGHVPRYFYNTSSKKCEKFIYGGCKGNKNNFEKLAKCQETCEKKPGICPKPPPGTITTCDVACQSDWECPESQKCCSYGCRIACYQPVRGHE